GRGPPPAGLIFRSRFVGMVGFGLRYGVGVFVVVALLVLAPVLGGLLLVSSIRRQAGPLSAKLARRFFASYDVADGLFSSQPLRELFVRLFDPGYYGA